MTTMIAPTTTPDFTTRSNHTLTQAHSEWAKRPADQRFGSLEALHAAVLQHRVDSAEAAGVDLTSLRVEAAPVEGREEPEPVLVSSTGLRAGFTHNGFAQLAKRVGAPPRYLRQLPAALAADNLNHGLQLAKHTAEEHRGDNLLFATGGGQPDALRLRCAVSADYTRIWNADVTSRLLRLVQERPEWQPAPAAFDGSRGLYASDEDMFAFLVDNDRRIFERGPGGGLARGFFLSNSETGNGSFVLTTFWYEFVCGNHRVWGAQGVQELRIRHVGKADERVWGELQVELRKYADASAAQDEAKVASMRMRELGKTKDEVLDAVLGLRVRDVTKRLVAQAYEVAEQHADWYGAPTTVWGLTGGLTQVARDLPNASDRVALERAAGKVMQIAF